MDFSSIQLLDGVKSDLRNVSVFRQPTAISRTPNLRSCLLCIPIVSYKWILYSFSLVLSSTKCSRRGDLTSVFACTPLSLYSEFIQIFWFFEFLSLLRDHNFKFLDFHTIQGMLCGNTNFLYALNRTNKKLL